MCWKRETRRRRKKCILLVDEQNVALLMVVGFYGRLTTHEEPREPSLRWLSAFGHQTLLNFAHSSDSERRAVPEESRTGSSWWQAEWRMEGKRRWRNFMIQRTETLGQTHKSLNGPKIQFTLNSKGKYVAVIWLSSNNSSCASDIFPSGPAVCGFSVTSGNW